LQRYKGRDQQRHWVLPSRPVLVTNDLGLIEEKDKTIVTLLQGGLDGLEQGVSEIFAPPHNPAGHTSAESLPRKYRSCPLA
jgi:hypothetical protein